MYFIVFYFMTNTLIMAKIVSFKCMSHGREQVPARSVYAGSMRVKTKTILLPCPKDNIHFREYNTLRGETKK
jgi:hypothetical protein